jgi:hypothetical protein
MTQHSVKTCGGNYFLIPDNNKYQHLRENIQKLFKFCFWKMFLMY